MELFDFASQIIFSPDLNQKITTPTILTDNLTAQPLKLPDLPDRALKIQICRQRASFPTPLELATSSGRAKALHFFANHELLALELMAWTILAFPDANPEFRMMVAKTICDEQKHFRLYQNRMHELGIEFGDFPLGGYFWNALHLIKSPSDYNAIMGLCFEQANLDFAKHYYNLFHEHEDYASAQILQTVYWDEIKHVRDGLQWYQTFNPDCEEKLWEKWSQDLEFPLSPARAKGNQFDEDGRRKAGFKTPYIENLKNFKGGKGKLGSIWHFNPEFELQLIGKSAPKEMEILKNDLSEILLYCSQIDDHILCRRQPNPEFKQKLLTAGFYVPRFLENLPKNHSFQKFASFEAWGFSADIIRELKGVTFSDPNFREQVFLYEKNPELIKQINSKNFACALRLEFLEQHPQYYDTVGPIYSIEIKTLEDIKIGLKKIREEGFAFGLLKGNWGASGRQQLRLRTEEKISAHDELHCQSILKYGAILEPLVERILDFSQIFHIGDANNHHSLKGLYRFIVDNRRQYKGHYRLFPNGIWEQNPQKIIQKLGKFVVAKLKTQGYKGPGSIDGYTYLHKGKIYINFLSEINARMTMGHIAHHIFKQVAPNLDAYFGIDKLPASFEEKAIERNKELKIIRGKIILNDTKKAKGYYAFLEVDVKS